MSAPEAILTLPGAAIVGDDGTIDSACGSHPCQRYRAPAAVMWLLGPLLGLAALAGFGLVVARSTPATAKRTEWAAQRLSFAALAVAAIGYGFPRIVVWAGNGGWLLQASVVQSGSAGTIAVLGALAAQLRPFLGGIGSKASESKLAGTGRRLAARIRPLLVRIVGLVVGPLVALAVAVGFASYAAWQSKGQNQPDQLGLWLALLGPLVLLLLSGDLNEWSLHPFYRDRLRRAYAVDPVLDPPEDPREDPLQELTKTGPQLIICAAANVADSRVTPLGRPVLSWTFRRTEMGSAALAAPRKAADTGAAEGFLNPETLPPHLKHLGWAWTAVAVSGAAFAPAMGKMTRPERFLLVLGNLRLGVWYPNPRWFAEDPGWYSKRGPRPWYLAKEALGLHKVHDRWLYLTDGGHYENLGLLELLRQGCRQVYCFDAAGDRPGTFGTLADAVRLAREELGIEMDFQPTPMIPDVTGRSRVGVCAGTVLRPGETKPGGWVVVAKLSVPVGAPFDIIDLARTLPSFPTHPTADQLYTDQKFEAYRALGHYLGEQAVMLGTRINQLTNEGRSVAVAVRTANAELISP